MENPLPHKLAAILYADVAGYSRLTAEDEEGTHRKLSEYLDVISDAIRRHRGRVVHYAGDAVLADFDTASGAVACAVAFQRELAKRNATLPVQRRVEFRVGVNLGEANLSDANGLRQEQLNLACGNKMTKLPEGLTIPMCSEVDWYKHLHTNR